jgi:hypothetical protein
MELIFVVAFWALLAMAADWYADRLGRSSVGWALFSLILSPLLGFVMLFALGERRDEEDDQEEAADRAPCPFCAESIVRAAKRRRFCRSDLPPAWATDVPRRRRRL